MVKVIALLLLLTVSANADLLDDFSLYQEFTHLKFRQFMTVYKKPYQYDPAERAIRYEIFLENLERIDLLNKNERGSAVYGVTIHADLTPREFKKLRLGMKRIDTEARNVIIEPRIARAKVPDSFDWRTRPGVVSKVKNQGMCGSCWAFSATGNVEGVWAVKKNASVSLSEQELVDCDKLDNGCGGGLPTNAFKTIMQLGGLESEKDYPYDGENERCKFNSSVKLVTISGYKELPKDENYIKNYLALHGPISIGINANAMQFYWGGISHPIEWLCDPENLDHGVLIVGYGVTKTRFLRKTLPYWIIKNSWGSRWGEHGYYRVYRGGDTCGVSQMASSAIVD